MTLKYIKARWLKARIAYHKRQAHSYSRPLPVRSHTRDGYHIWMRNMALRHNRKAHELERRLLLAGG